MLVIPGICATILVVTGSIILTSCESLPAQRFAIEPVDKTAIINDTVLLACRVVNKMGAIQWTRDSFGLGMERELVGYPRYEMTGNDEEGDFSLQIRNVQLEDDARFQCQVGAADGVMGIRSRDAVLTVHVPPDPPTIAEGEYMKTTAGTEVSLTCEAQNGKPAAELTWLNQNGNPVPSDQVVHTTHLLSDGKRANSVLKWTFVASKDHDGKTFTCRSENPALRKPHKARIRLKVKYPPAVMLIIQRERVLEGEDVRFTCNATANPAVVMYKWFRNDEVIVGYHATSYTMKQVSLADNGTKITCEVSNALGVGEASHVLNIHVEPVVQEVTLICDVAENSYSVNHSAHRFDHRSLLLIPFLFHILLYLQSVTFCK